MTSPTNEIKTPVGRLVGGHPMDQRPNTDDKTGAAKMQKDGVTPSTSAYVGLALPKGTETDWKQTPWGQQIYQAGTMGWPNGEHGAPTFAWKVTDGDSPVPNKKGKVPNQREGWPGNWILHCSTGIPIKCYHAGRYDPTQQIQNRAEIKPGDYCRLVLNARGNAPSESPGVYLNPTLFELSRPGVEIQLDNGPSAADAFGDSAPVLPANAQVDPNVGAQAQAAAPAPPADAVAPAPDFLNAPVKTYNVGGKEYTEAQLLASKWTPAQIAALGQ